MTPPCRPSLILLLAAIVCASASASGRTQNVSEPALKAAFVLNFAKFTEWPAQTLTADSPLVVCSADDAVSPALESTMAGQTIQQRPILLTRVSVEDSLAECDVLYAGRLDRQRTAQLTERLRGTSVLTIGDDQAFAAAGGMIGLFLEGGRMRFAINIGAAERGPLRLSTKLLSLARIVKD